MTLQELLYAARVPERAKGNAISHIDPVGLVELARVIALQRILPGDQEDGLALYDLALQRFGASHIPSLHQGVHVQLACQVGNKSRAADLLKTYSGIPDHVRIGIDLDLANPFVDGNHHGPNAWLDLFQRLFTEPHPGLTDERNLLPFDRLTAGATLKIARPEKISVVVTSYNPNYGLVTAVRSLIAQSWDNVEILIVDDGSPPEYDGTLKDCLALDERVRLVKLDFNQGTYVARNAALESASGEFVTFHDSDDWCHPRRLEAQVRPLLDDSSIVASVSDAVKVTDHFVFTQAGRIWRDLCTSSLMFRRPEVLERIGYLDSVRKAADTEYVRRIEAAYGANAVRRLRGHLYTVIRQKPDSLSYADFRAGWMHPARAAYRSAYGLWHEQIKAEETSPHLPKSPSSRPFPAPSHLLRNPEKSGSPQSYDVVFASDWRPFGGPQKSMLEEIGALIRGGKRVGVVHMEAYRFMTVHRKPLCEPIQSLINAGDVDHILLSDNVDISLLIIRYPPVLQFAGVDLPDGIRVDRVIILANQAPSEADGTDLRYVPAACTEVARTMFRVEPQWCPQGPAVRAVLQGELRRSELTAYDMPSVIDMAEWGLERTGFRSDRPVIGRHSRDNWTKWPADRASLLQVYPDSLDFDVRIMGGATVARALLGSTVPVNWLVYGYDEVSVRSFLYQIDFYAYFPHPNMIEAFGRAILEALAAGCVVILPHHFFNTFGDAAVYCEPADVQGTVRRYYSDPKRFLAQSRLAQDIVRQRFSHGSYFELVSSILTQPLLGGQPVTAPIGR